MDIAGYCEGMHYVSGPLGDETEDAGMTCCCMDD